MARRYEAELQRATEQRLQSAEVQAMARRTEVFKELTVKNH